MPFENYFIAAFRLLCLILALYLIFQGLDWLFPKIQAAAKELVERLY